MPSRIFNSGGELHRKILEGVNILADYVASTLGPRGRNVILHEKGNNPIITKDGVTVSNFVDLEDPFQNVGAQVIKQVAAKTNMDAGDGTTTSIVLARAILEQSQKYLIAGVSPVEIKRGMDKAVDAIISSLGEMSRPVKRLEDIEHIATISANGDQSIGKLIATAVDKAGKNGAITIEEARSLQTSLDVAEGYRFGSGYVASAFITDERRGVVSYEDPLILITDYKLESVEELLPILEIVARDGRPFVVIAEEIEGQALAALIMNAVRGTMKIAAIKAPQYGEERKNILYDLAKSVGATIISRETRESLKNAKLENLGSARKIEITKYLTTIVGAGGDYEEVEKHIDSLKLQLSKTESEYESKKIQERVTALASGIAIIRVGAATEIEMIEKKHRIEDALEAVKSSQIGGILPGGGVALLRSVKNLNLSPMGEEQALGVQIIKRAVKEPIRQMAKNAGKSPDIILSMVENEKEGYGYDFFSNEIVDMFAEGIIDPTLVTQSALRNATSAAATLITTNHAIIKS